MKTKRSRHGARLLRWWVATLAVSAVHASSAYAADTIKIGTPEPRAFNFGMLDAGTQLGIFAKNGIEIERLDLGGGAKLHQGMAAGAIDAALGGGTDLQFLVKGSPEKGVAMMGTAPSNLAVLVRMDSPIKSVADLKGKKIGASTVGSLTSWLGMEIARREGWGADGIALVYVGGMDGTLAALTANNIDASVGNLEVSYMVEAEGKFRIVVRGGDVVQDFVASIIYASDTMIAQHPDVLRRFLKAWFETIVYMQDHKAEAIPIMAKIMNARPDITAKVYDAEMPAFPVDGHFDRAKLRIVEEALLGFHLINAMPDESKLLNESFLP
jgi:NitT/TauT family transport system substrate-binding protein